MTGQWIAVAHVLSFVMKKEGVTFYEALKLLAERNGIPIPKRAEYSDPETKLRAALHQMHELAEQAFRDALHGAPGAEARAYLEKRGVAPEIAVKKLSVKKKTVMAIYAEETGGDRMTSATFWDGKKYRYQPIGSSMEQ